MGEVEGIIHSSLSCSWGLGLCWQTMCFLPWALLESGGWLVLPSRGGGGTTTDCWRRDGAATSI